MKTFAERFNNVLAEKKIRQIDVSNRTGIAPGTISNYAQGKYEPKGLNLEKIARELDVNEAWLAGYDAPKAREELDPSKAIKNLESRTAFDKWEEEYYDQDLPFAELSEDVTREEMNLLTSYRDADPAIQAAVRKLLDVEDPS